MLFVGAQFDERRAPLPLLPSSSSAAVGDRAALAARRPCDHVAALAAHRRGGAVRGGAEARRRLGVAARVQRRQALRVRQVREAAAEGAARDHVRREAAAVDARADDHDVQAVHRHLPPRPSAHPRPVRRARNSGANMAQSAQFSDGASIISTGTATSTATATSTPPTPSSPTR